MRTAGCINIQRGYRRETLSPGRPNSSSLAARADDDVRFKRCIWMMQAPWRRYEVITQNIGGRPLLC